jgi:lipoprotein-anchoring transpeptidase ErfK/SrfK
MFRIASSIIIATVAISSVAFAQNEELPAEGKVLKAQQIGGDEFLNSEDPGTVPDAPKAPTEAAPVAPAEAAATPIESTASTEPSPLDVMPTGEDAVRLQVFLDELNFGPGVIDGKPGQFSQLAVQSWNEVNGHPLLDWTAVNTAARKAVPNPFATAIVPKVVKSWVDGSLPTSKTLQAKRKRMTYRSIAEFMSERYHTDVAYLIQLNGKKKVYSLKPQDTLIVPNVKPFTIETLTGAIYKLDEALSQRHVVVDTKKNQARFYEAAPVALVIDESEGADAAPKAKGPNRGLIASFPITPGQPRFIHYGKWAVRNTVEFPSWRYDKSLLKTGKRSADSETLEIPPGPNSPVGVLWCGLTKSGIGLHGTSDPETIGRARSSGCIRLANWDAVRLPTLIRPGTTVEIR